MSETATSEIAELLERTLGRFLQLHELTGVQVDEATTLCGKLSEDVADLGLTVLRIERESKARIEQLAADVAECERRLTHVHQKALRALTDLHAGGTKAP